MEGVAKLSVGLSVLALAVAVCALARHPAPPELPKPAVQQQAPRVAPAETADRGSVGRALEKILSRPEQHTAMKPATAPAPPPVVPDSWRVPFWAFDPTQSLPCSRDTNTCTQDTCGAGNAGPCLTLGEIVRRLGTWEPQFQQSTVLEQLSDDTNWQNPIFLKPWVGYPSTFEYRGALHQVGTATIGAYTPLNRTAPSLGKITAQGQSGNFWAPFVTSFVVDVTANAIFWIDSDLGTATAAISTPLAPWSIAVGPPAYVTIAPGDSLILYHPTHAWCAEAGDPRYAGALTYMRHMFCDTGPQNPISLSDVAMPLIESQVGDATIISLCNASLAAFWVNDMLGSSAAEPLGGVIGIEGTWIGGDIKIADLDIGCPVNHQQVTFDGDILIKERQHLGNHALATFGRAYMGGGNALHTYASFGQMQIGVWSGGDGIYYADSRLWGPSSLELDDGEALICQRNCAAQLILSGQLFIGTGSGQPVFSTAFQWNDTTAMWSAPAVTITPAAIDAAAAMCRPGSDTCFYSRQLP